MTNNTANNNANDNNEVRDNLRDAGEALLMAGSSIGAALSKVAGDLTDRFKSTSDEARANFDSATTEGEVRSAATSFTEEAEKLLNSLRERDLQFTDDLKETVTAKINEARANFNDRLAKADTSGSTEAQGVVSEIRARFEELVARIQDQVSNSTADGDIIDGEIIESDNQPGSGTTAN